jgi:DNA-binding transcriptional LysR family regulator
MQPTAKALRLAPGIQAALADLSATLTDAAPFALDIVARTFTVASTDYTRLVVIPALLAAVEAQAPNIDVRVIGYDKGDIPELIDRGEIDLALGVFKDAPPRAVRTMLCAERFVGLCRRGNPLRQTDPCRWRVMSLRCTPSLLSGVMATAKSTKLLRTCCV